MPASLDEGATMAPPTSLGAGAPMAVHFHTTRCLVPVLVHSMPCADAYLTKNVPGLPRHAEELDLDISMPCAELMYVPSDHNERSQCDPMP